MKILELIIFSILYIPFCVKVHKAGVERYHYYDRLAFWNSLSDDEKESAGWYV